MSHRTLTIILTVAAIALFGNVTSAQMPPHMMQGMMAKSEAEAELKAPDQHLIVTLDNGMEVMFIENHASPVIASVVIVHAGAKYETVELNGASHYLEHLLFNGTETRTQKELYDEMDFLGGYNNASTGYDHATYMILIDAENFEKGLDIQRDMLFHSILPPDKFEKEKGIIIEEIGKDEDSESYRVSRFLDRVIYRGTPYEWPVLGSRRSIREMTRDQVWDYYKSRYVPNNMAAMIVGDFHTPEMLDLIKRTFGQESPKELPKTRQRVKKKQGRAKPAAAPPIFVQQGDATSHTVLLSLNAPTRQCADYFPFIVMVNMLNDHLQEDLMSNTDLGITQASASNFADADFSVLNLSLSVNPSKNYEDALQEVRASVDRFLEAEFDPERVKAVVTSIRSEDIFNSERPHFYGMMKSGDLAAGGAYFLLHYLDNLAAVTSADVAKVARTTLHLERATVAVYEAVDIAEAEEEVKKARRTLRKKLPNGMLVVVQENSDNPIFAAHFLFKHRSAYEAATGAKMGTVDFLHHVLDYGPAGMSRDEFQAELQKYGARAKLYDMAFIPYDDYYTSPEFSFVRLEAMDENWLPVLKLLAEDVMHPDLTPATVEPVRGRMTGLSQQGLSSVSKAGRALFKRALYGDSPFSAHIIGSPEEVASTSLEDLTAFAEKYLSPQNLILTISSGNDPEAIMSQVESLFGDWANSSSLPEITQDRPSGPAREVEETGGKEQSFLGMGYTFEVQDPADRAALTLLNAILSERMQFQLREREGLAYTLGSSVSFHDDWGVWAASMGTGPQNLERAREGILDEVRKAAKEKFTDHDVDKARNAYLGRLLLRGLTKMNQTYLMGLGEFAGEGFDRHQVWVEELRAVSPEDVRRVARTYLKTDEMTVAILR